MKRIAFSIMLLVSIIMGYSQRIAKVSASYTYYASETMSVEEAKRTALDRAKIQAIADEFGTIVSQSTSTIVSNKNGLSDTQFFSLGGSDVKGEWIETIREPNYDIKFSDHLLVVTVQVNGIIKEIPTTKFDLDARILRNGTEKKYEATDFRDGDEMCLYFKSPIAGKLIVYLMDQGAKSVFSILPYPKATYSSYEIEANKEYVFFSKKMADEIQKAIVEEYTLTCSDTSKEINDIIIVFSTDQMSLPSLTTKRIGNKPPSIDYESFNKWRANVMKRNNNLTVKSITLTIQK